MLGLIHVGDRCQISKRMRGKVAWVGLCEEIGEGKYVGIELDEPIGTDVYGKFDCKPKFGILVKPDQVECGDFPEDEINLDDSDSEL